MDDSHASGDERNMTPSKGKDAASGDKRKSRTRTIFDAYQLQELERAFAENKTPDQHARNELAERLKLREQTVLNFFQNRRKKEYAQSNNKATKPAKPKQAAGGPIRPAPRSGDRAHASGGAHDGAGADGQAGAGANPPYHHAQHGHPQQGWPRPPVPHPGLVQQSGADAAAHGAHPHWHPQHPCCSCVRPLHQAVENLASVIPGLQGTDHLYILEEAFNYISGVRRAVNRGMPPQPLPPAMPRPPATDPRAAPAITPAGVQSPAGPPAVAAPPPAGTGPQMRPRGGALRPVAPRPPAASSSSSSTTPAAKRRG